MLPPGHPAGLSRYLAQNHRYRALAGLNCLGAAVTAAEPDLVVPLDDRAVALLLALAARAPASGTTALVERSLGNARAYETVLSRNGFLAAAHANGIRTPTSCAVHREEDLLPALEQTGLPAVLKADGTWGGDGVAIVHDRDEALSAWRRFAQRPSMLRSLLRAIRRADAHFLLHAVPTLSVQQYVPGTAATTSLAAWKGRLLAANHMEAVITRGAGGPCSVLRRIDNAAMGEAALQLAAHFGLSGLHGLDYVMDREGEPWLVEINPRATQSSHLSFGPGHDLVAALASKAGGSLRSARECVAADTVALFPQEFLRDAASPWLKSAYHDVPWDDLAMVRNWVTAPEAIWRAEADKPSKSAPSYGPRPPALRTGSTTSR